MDDVLSYMGSCKHVNAPGNWVTWCSNCGGNHLCENLNKSSDQHPNIYYRLYITQRQHIDYIKATHLTEESILRELGLQ